MIASVRPAMAEDPVLLVFSRDLAPLSFDQGGEVRGILPDVASDIFAALGQPVILALYPWERAQQMVREGDADGFITNATPARLAYAECGKIPVLRAPLHPILRWDHPAFDKIAAATSLDDLRGYKFISYAGNGWARQHLADAGFDVYFANSYEAQLKGLSQGRGDLALVTMVSGDFFQRALALEQDLVMLPLVVDTFQYVLCLGRQSPHRGQLSAFEAALGRMRMDGSYPAILEYYGLKATTPY